MTDAAPPRPPDAPFCVLVADAGLPVNQRIVSLLSDVEGLSVFGCAQEPAKVIDLVRLVRPDVAIFDLRSLGVSAVATLASVRALDRHPIAIVISDYDEPALRQTSLTAGADFFFEKSTSWPSLLDVLGRLQHEGRP